MSEGDGPSRDSISDTAFADIIQDVLDHLEDTSEQNIAQEFQSLELESDVQAKPSRKTAVAPANFRKNRYKDILPFDYNRIVLDDELDDDYINASMIQDHEGADFLIASQAPLPATVNDFWRMCWLYKVPCILMLCNLVENGRKKCEKYYPTNINEPIETDHFWITLEKSTPLFDDLIVRVLIVAEKQGSKGRHTVKHVQYTSWPDFGISESLPRIEMLIKACQMNRDRLKEEDHLVYGYITTANHNREFNSSFDSSNNPIVVHCSAGCGRTGTIACLLYIVKLLQTKSLKKNFNLIDLVLQMRQQRLSMVQNQAQYAFLIKFVHEHLLTRALEELISGPQTVSEIPVDPFSTASVDGSSSKLDGISRTPDEHSEYEMCWNSETQQTQPSGPPPSRDQSDHHEYMNIGNPETEPSNLEQDSSDDVIEENAHGPCGPIPVISLSSSNPFEVDCSTSDSQGCESPKSPRGNPQSPGAQKDSIYLKRVPAIREHRSVSPGVRKPQNAEMKGRARASVNLASSSCGSGVEHEYVMLSDCNSDAISTSDVINPIMCQSSGSSRTFASFLMQSNSFRGGSRPVRFNQESKNNQGETGSGQLRPCKSQENLYNNKPTWKQKLKGFWV